MTPSAIADEKYLVLHTRKKNGDTVATPVWIAALPGGGLGFTTELTSGKVKRIRNFPDVTLQPSNTRGVPKAGTSPVAGTASVLTGAEADAVERAIKAKYGFQVTLINVAYSIGRVVQRRAKQPGCAVRIDIA